MIAELVVRGDYLTAAGLLAVVLWAACWLYHILTELERG